MVLYRFVLMLYMVSGQNCLTCPFPPGGKDTDVGSVKCLKFLEQPGVGAQR